MVGRLYMLAVVGLSWVFFRAPSLPAALGFLHAMIGFGGTNRSAYPVAAFVDARTLTLLPLALLACTPLFSALTQDWRARARQSFGQVALAQDAAEVRAAWIDRCVAAVRLPMAAGVMSLSLCYIAGQTYNPFIYFRF